MAYIDRKLYTVLGNALRDARDDAQMTLSDAAKAIGVTTMTIQRYEKAERKANIETIRRLCSLYEIDPDDFMQRTIDKFHSIYDSRYSSEPASSGPEAELLSLFRELNEDGQTILLNTAAGLLASGAYKK